MQAAKQLNLFEKRLPRRPYCTDDFKYGLRILEKIQAVEKRYIQANQPIRKCWFPYDVDRPGGGYDWEQLEAPAPNLVIENPENLHAHLLYGLSIPVHTSLEAKPKPLRYAAAIDCALAKKLGADPYYSGLIVKNPLHRHWTVRICEERLYDLDWLADYLDLERWWDRRRKMPDYGLGRNCTLFEHLRRWAYRAINQDDWKSLDAWAVGVLHKAAEYNDFNSPLSYAEVKAIARSVARWTWKHFSPQAFSQIQAARGRRSGKVRKEKSLQRQLLLSGLEDLGSTTAARVTGVPEQTIRRWRSERQRTISDISGSRDRSRTISDISVSKRGNVSRSRSANMWITFKEEQTALNG